jgi:HNH endonuclease
MLKICSSEDCCRQVEARGLCSTHYMQQRRAGLIPVGARARGTVEERFFRHIKKTDSCWIWQGRVKGKGYGSIGLGGAGAKDVLAHRVSYQIHKGGIPDGLIIMHKCDNPRCVNPDHLEAGTQSQNIKDAFARGRKVSKPSGLMGESHGASKLNNEIVYSVRSSTLTAKALSILYGVSTSAIERIKNRRTWKHLI